MINRTLNLLKLLSSGHSAFLFGPRGVGKSTLVDLFFQETTWPSLSINLLHSDNYTRYLKRPHLFRKEVENRLEKEKKLFVAVDEIQKIPILLDEIHALIEKHKKKIHFLMTGSSARKLKRSGANLLADRAWTMHLHPLSHLEIEVDLERALRFGTLPRIYLEEEHPERSLKSYVQTYLKEEILEEAQIRKVDSFARFLEVAGQMNGETVNFTKVGNEANVSTKSAQEWFQILEDTMLARKLPGWSHSVRKQLLQAPKYYFFDCGVLNALTGMLGAEPSPSSFIYGKLFETFFIQEAFRMNDYFENSYQFHYWRTNNGREVDLVLYRNKREPLIGIEIKSAASPTRKDLRGLDSFLEDNPKAHVVCACQTARAYVDDGISFLPWKEALARFFKPKK